MDSRIPSRLARLNLDFSELLSSPYDGVSIHLNDEDMYKFCLHLCPASGPYTGLRLHFDVQLPDTVSPPLSFFLGYTYKPWRFCDTVAGTTTSSSE
jgi:ubiquitin-protein ligase